ncbi:hypothetical protein HDV00_010770 [Rhizophlyctis rosea]|nr:hypothetical protein HDV00_010770 [Rhizophlyctis rosea]
MPSSLVIHYSAPLSGLRAVGDLIRVVAPTALLAKLHFGNDNQAFSPLYELSYLLVSLTRYIPSLFSGYPLEYYGWIQVYIIIVSALLVASFLFQGAFHKCHRRPWLLLLLAILLNIWRVWFLGQGNSVRDFLVNFSLHMESLTPFLAAYHIKFPYDDLKSADPTIRASDLISLTPNIPLSLPIYLTAMFAYRFLYLIRWSIMMAYSLGYIDTDTFLPGVFQAMAAGGVVIYVWVLWGWRRRVLRGGYVAVGSEEDDAGDAVLTKERDVLVVI